MITICYIFKSLPGSYLEFRLKGGRLFEGVRIINNDINTHEYSKNKDIIWKKQAKQKQKQRLDVSFNKAT